METKVSQPRKAFTVMIHDKEHDIYDIEGKEHKGLNDTIKTWWLYYSDRLPEGTLPPIDSEYLKPWDVGILRRCWEIKIKQTNSSKHKWGETDFRNHTSVQMWCNGKLIYEFGTNGKYLDFAMAKVQYLQVMLSEHPYNFFEPETEQGRKIWWYGLPATIQVKSCTWEIAIIPDYTAGLTKAEWWKELTRRESKYMNAEQYNSLSECDKEELEMDKEDSKESEENDYINWGDAFSDQHINWFRK